MSVYNVQASQSATLSGAITVNNATWEVDSGDTLTVSGAVSGTGGVTKNGTGTLVLSGSNSYTGATAVNSGTLVAGATNALGNSTAVDIYGGSLLVTADNAINDAAAINLGGGVLALSGTFDESVGLLTLSSNSVINLDGFSGVLRFGGVGSWGSGANLAIWNWSGTTPSGTQINNYANPSHVVFTDQTGLTGNLGKISFFSGSGTGFIGNAFEQSFSQSGFATSTEIIAVPEPETYAVAVILLLGLGIHAYRTHRRRTEQKQAQN
jgi:autotransporter-associated beta strand protein